MSNIANQSDYITNIAQHITPFVRIILLVFNCFNWFQVETLN